MENKEEYTNVEMEIRQQCGRTKVFVYGKEITGIRKLSLTQSTQELPVLTLEILPRRLDVSTLADVMQKFSTLDG